MRLHCLVALEIRSLGGRENGQQPTYCSSCSTPLFQYLNISSAEGTFAGRTNLNPSHCASV
jgi:hypothetical protein